MVDEVLDPREVGVPRRRHPVLPPLVILELISPPVAVVEWRVCQYEVRLQVRMLIVVEAVPMGDLRLNPADGEVHLGQAPRCVVGLLSIYGDVTNSAAVRFYELLAAYEHPARAAAGVVHPALVRGEHLDEHSHH